jgi:hypothetical protein
MLRQREWKKQEDVKEKRTEDKEELHNLQTCCSLSIIRENGMADSTHGKGQIK